MVQSALVEASSQPPRALRFGIFEMDLDSEELRKNGLIRKLARQPFRMLATIAEAQGKVVTYEELRSKLWSPNVNIEDYKHGLSNWLLDIRKMLGDSAAAPCFIKTVPRGYKFLVQVELIYSSNHKNGSGNLLAEDFQAEIQQIRQELLVIQSALNRPKLLERNRKNPPISPETAIRVFQDPHAITVPAPFEGRTWFTIGRVSKSVLLVVEHVERHKNGKRFVWPWRARRAKPEERRFYERTRKEKYIAGTRLSRRVR
jgi:DNA-binding winged helix-turn-helix (wHTH) protein/uncharacterized DUF497 family protein